MAEYGAMWSVRPVPGPWLFPGHYPTRCAAEPAVRSAVSAHNSPMEPLRGKIVCQSGAGREVRVSAAEAASALVLGQAICFIPEMLRYPNCGGPSRRRSALKGIQPMFDSVRRAAALAVVFAVLVPSPAPAAGDKDEKRDDPVVAIVNGAPIQRSDVEEARGRLPARMRQLPLQAVFDLLLDSLINTKLVAGQAREQGLHEEEKIKRQMARIEDQILERAFLVRYIEKRVTEDTLQERYKKLVEETKGKEEISARHILVETEGRAREIIADLKKGEDFAELAKKRSTGPSAAAGGDLGFFSADQMVPEFAEAAFALDKGQFTETPVKTQFGWHVIKVEDRRAAKPPAVEEVSETLRADLAREIGSAYIQGLREKADVQRFNPDGSPLKDGGKAQAPQ